MTLLELLQTSPGWLVTTVLLLGLLVGSFLNVVTLRLPARLQHQWRTESREILELDGEHEAPPPGLVTPRSRCPQCGVAIRALDNVPLLSWLLLRGRCRDCGAGISLRYPVVEAVTGLLSAWLAWHLGAGWELVFGLLLTWSLIALTVIDLDHFLLPDNITLPLLWAGLLLSLGGWFTDPVSAIIGATAGYLSLWSIFHLFRLLTGKEGMGYGDFKLLAALGAWLGWQALPGIVLLSSLVGAVVGIALIVATRQDRSVPIPFGPYLASAGWIMFMWGDQINLAYLRWVGM